MTIAVTGATGNIGGAVAHALSPRPTCPSA